jgi:hypothetical protein
VELPVKRYLLYSILISILLVLAIALYQRTTLIEKTTVGDISGYLRDFVIINYTYTGGSYSIYMAPIKNVFVTELSVNQDYFGDVLGTVEKNKLFLVEGSSSGNLKIIVRYRVTGFEHAGYAIIPES